MSIHVRMKKSTLGLRTGEDAVVDVTTAKFLKQEDAAWITGGDAADLEAAQLECDTEVGPSVPYPPRLGETLTVEVIKGQES